MDVNPDPSFADLADRLRGRIADDEAVFLVDEMQRQYGALLAHSALLSCQLKVAGLEPPARPVLELVS